MFPNNAPPQTSARSPYEQPITPQNALPNIYAALRDHDVRPPLSALFGHTAELQAYNSAHQTLLNRHFNGAPVSNPQALGNELHRYGIAANEMGTLIAKALNTQGFEQFTQPTVRQQLDACATHLTAASTRIVPAAPQYFAQLGPPGIDASQVQKTLADPAQSPFTKDLVQAQDSLDRAASAPQFLYDKLANPPSRPLLHSHFGKTSEFNQYDFARDALVRTLKYRLATPRTTAKDDVKFANDLERYGRAVNQMGTRIVEDLSGVNKVPPAPDELKKLKRCVRALAEGPGLIHFAHPAHFASQTPPGVDWRGLSSNPYTNELSRANKKLAQLARESMIPPHLEGVQYDMPTDASGRLMDFRASMFSDPGSISQPQYSGAVLADGSRLSGTMSTPSAGTGGPGHYIPPGAGLLPPPPNRSPLAPPLDQLPQRPNTLGLGRGGR